MRERGYVTLIRRNWHLLPYEQLLELVEMTPEQLAVTLREDDFLWVKLGQLKPQCAPLRYEPPTNEGRQRVSEIRRVVEAEFGDALTQPGEPRFDFVRQLGEPRHATTERAAGDASQALRIVYSYVSVFGDPLLNAKLNPYPDGLLERLADVGINGVWLHAVLRDLAPGGATFPEFGAGHEQRLASLRAMVERAAKYGIRIYLYINEPRAMPASFFDQRSDMAGVREKEFTALCTSHPAVRRWLGDALAHVFREVPGLGGVYTITASENLTNCASHSHWKDCVHCKERSDADIISEVNAVIEEGVHRSSPEARVLVSDWGWRGHGEAPDIIAKLPKNVTLMSVSEWGLPIERGGIKSIVGEYSISAVGPGPRAQKEWQWAHEAMLKTGTEIQFNNTCEIASLPYLPVMDLVGEHCRNLVPAKLDAMFIGWTQGGCPSPNFELARRMSQSPAPELESTLDALAGERFGPTGGPHARRAWTLMSDAFRQYPFHVSVIYTSPVQCGPANPLHATKTGYQATMWGLPYDALDHWRGPYPREVFAQQFEKVAAGWRQGLVEMEKAVTATPKERRKEAHTDLVLARAAAVHFQSVANQARFIIARDALAQPKELTPDANAKYRAEIKRLLEAEIALAREHYTLVQQDSRIGFEPSCQYFFLPIDLVEKVINCRWLLDHFE
jgi:hypothetical protein